jgi:NADH-quinone oxidoreductase subunit L
MRWPARRPVSALIHAATMVTAGVYMIGRLSFLYDMAPVTLAIVAAVGAATALFAASIALVQTRHQESPGVLDDQPAGLHDAGNGRGGLRRRYLPPRDPCLLQSVLVPGAGSVIHALHHEQDIRHMGGLRVAMPRTYRTFAIATLAIAGIPPLPASGARTRFCGVPGRAARRDGCCGSSAR